MSTLQGWLAIVDAVAAQTHQVDRDGLRIWFAMWPELIQELVAPGPEQEKRLKFFQMSGQFELTTQADTSHQYLYGHRYWAKIKQALARVTATERWARIEAVARESGAPQQFALAMAAIAVMTLEQCGEGWLASGYTPADDGLNPDDWLRRRATPLKPSWIERLSGRVTQQRVIFDEESAEGWFPVLPQQEITTAAELDKRPYHLEDQRCYEGMGPIPVDCRAGSCGTCWVGILGGNDQLDPVEEFERKRMEYFGYWDSGFVDGNDERPLLRLGCQARVNGSVSIVIPPWNGVFGRSRREREKV